MDRTFSERSCYFFKNRGIFIKWQGLVNPQRGQKTLDLRFVLFWLFVIVPNVRCVIPTKARDITPIGFHSDDQVVNIIVLNQRICLAVQEQDQVLFANLKN